MSKETHLDSEDILIMKENYKKIVTLFPDIWDLKMADAKKLTSTSAGVMDLHLDIFFKEKNYMLIALHHDFKQNGDLISDPHMEISLENMLAMPHSYQDSLVYQRVFEDDDTKYKPELLKQLTEFLHQWLDNCINSYYK